MDPLTVASSQLDELISRLTPRQIQIVELLVQGRTMVDTAALLSISRETVKMHVKTMCYKLDVDNRIQVIVIYARWKETNGEQCDLRPEARE